MLPKSKVPRVIELGAGMIQSSENGDILMARIKEGVLVCALQGNRAAAFVLDFSAREKLRTLLSELVKRMGKGTQFKIVGVEELRIEAREFLSKYPTIELTGDAPARDFEAFIYAATSRVRVRELAAKSSTIESVPAAGPAPVRVLIVDDSKTIRNLLRQVLSGAPGIEVVGEAERPSQAIEMIEKLKPSVITLDINMPEMDGVTFLDRYLPKFPVPTVMVTAISMQDGDQVLRALNLGAVDYVQKPSLEEMKHVAPLIVEKIRVASSVVVRQERKSRRFRTRDQLEHADSRTVVAIGASTGGVQALESLLTGLPEKIPPIVVVQHIPPVFSAAFAKRLNDVCPFEVREACDGDEIVPDRVLIAAGGTQMSVHRVGDKLKVKVFDGPPVNRHKPSVDVLFDSVAEVIGKDAIGVILTGMGADGAKGLLKMRNAGARTVAQDQDSCVVFGMPRAAIELGAAIEIKPLSEMPETVLNWLVRKKSA